MRIERLEVYQHDLPFAGSSEGAVYRVSGGRTFTTFDATLVRVVADDGSEGWGESTPFGATYLAAHAAGVRAGIAEMAPSLLGLDPRRHDRLNEAMDRALVGHLHAKAPIDVACWDLFGRSVGLPVCDLLGGRVEHRMPVISSIHTGDPDDMRRRVAEHRELGYLGHSVKVGALDHEGGPALDAERVAASLADARPGEYYIVDANGGMTVESALRFLALVPDGLDFVFEAPCPTWTAHLALRARTGVAMNLDELATDDDTVAYAIATNAADGINLKVTKQGGLTRSRRQRDMCLAAGLAIPVQDTVGTEVAMAAVLYLGQTVPVHALRCVLDTRHMVDASVGHLDAPVVDGGVVAPDAPGLGVTPDLAVLGEPVAIHG